MTVTILLGVIFALGLIFLLLAIGVLQFNFKRLIKKNDPDVFNVINEHNKLRGKQ